MAGAPAPDGSPRPRLDAWALRGQAHPLRMRLLALLRAHGPSTASRLAVQLGVVSAATSYHLRRLAEHGFVVEEPGRGLGRERWWRAVHLAIDIELDDYGPEGHRLDDPDGGGAPPGSAPVVLQIQAFRRPGVPVAEPE